jgi:hypothetical protein
MLVLDEVVLGETLVPDATLAVGATAALDVRTCV